MMKTKKLGVIFALLILSLSMAGVASAHWSKIIVISGTVETGTLHVEPSVYIAACQDKPVAIVTGVADEAANTITITLENVYPCLWVYGYLDFHNTGSIPAALKTVTITSLSDNMPDHDLYIDYSDLTDIKVYKKGATLFPDTKLIMTGGLIDYGVDPDGNPCATLDQIDPVGIGPSVAYVYFAFHFEQDLPQDTDFAFVIELDFWNWNEA